jgi:hypothetical protein
MSATARVSFDDVFHALRAGTGFEFDDAWDTLRVIDDSYAGCADRLVAGLSDDAEYVRHYCIKALQKIEVVPSSLRERVAGAVFDSNKLVRIEAIRVVGKMLGAGSESDIATRVLRKAARDPKAPFEVRLRAWWMLRRAPRGKN